MIRNCPSEHAKWHVRIDGEFIGTTVEDVWQIWYDEKSAKWVFVADDREVYVKNDAVDVIDVRIQAGETDHE